MDMKRFALMFFYVCNIFILRTESYDNYRKADNTCQYYKMNSVAKCRKLHYIPSLKESVLALEIRLSYLPYINRQTFQNISSNKIIRLAFKMNNTIQAISNDAFSDLRYLQTLEVSFESQLDVLNFKSSLGSLNVSFFNELILESNGWTSLPGNLLNDLSGAKLSVLSLNENHFEILNASIFKPLIGLKKVFLRRVLCSIFQCRRKDKGGIN
ncbi:unnamed protein product [Mytilus edulis]|uniref:Uncharacterized protein n=1 Tax=Mytilus edulis TaxID=6550 RepID=A0A8S3V5B3_MYTED|nr:unnamed protein product [Mytilus edulis]